MRLLIQKSLSKVGLMTATVAIGMVAASCGASSTTAVGTSDSSAVAETASTTSATTPSSTSISTTSATSTSTSSTSATAATSPPGCSASELPAAGNPFTPVMVTGISAVDPDKGLNIRFDPGTNSGIQFSLPNGAQMVATGPCEKTADGSVWWEVEDGHWNGWTSPKYLTTNIPANPTCPGGTFSPVGKGTVERVLGDFDGNGSVDAMYLSYDGVVQAPNLWTGTTATLQVQYADGGLSNEVDITNIIGDGGPEIGLSSVAGFPERIDPANTFRSVAVLSSTYAGSATGAGLAHFAGVDGCNPAVLINIDVTPSVGNPQHPILCDIGGGGRVQLWALDGLDSNLNYVVTEYIFQGATFLRQSPITAGNANTLAEPAVC